MRSQFAVLEQSEKENQVEVSSTVVTACTNQSEHTRFSELMGNFSTCYTSVKCVHICFFCFHLLRYALKHVHQSCHFCRRNSVILQTLKSKFCWGMKSVLSWNLYFQLPLKHDPSTEGSKFISQNWRADEILTPLLGKNTRRQWKLSWFCL